MSDTEGDTSGTLLQGSDGAVYFIPHERLGEFRIADEDSAGVREALGELDSEVAGFAYKGPELKQGVVQMRAFEGPIGIKTTRFQESGNIASSVSGGDGIWGKA